MSLRVRRNVPSGGAYSRRVRRLPTTVNIAFRWPIGWFRHLRTFMNFTAAGRAALSKILRAGGSSGAAERAAVQKAMIWFDRRIGPIIGTDKRVANAKPNDLPVLQPTTFDL